MNVYWSNLKIFRECPKKYLWSKGHPEIDVGAGLGKPFPLPEERKDSEHHKLMGSVLSRVVEEIYNRQLWKKKSTLLQESLNIASVTFHELEPSHYCDWGLIPRQDALDTVLQGTKNFIDIMWENELVGELCESEWKFSHKANTSAGEIGFCGYADLIIRKDGDEATGKPEELFILDGKNAGTPGKYEDPDQLIWYALCMRLQYGQVPTKLGFFYFRFSTDTAPPNWDASKDGEWTGVHYVKWDANVDLQRMVDEAINTKKAIMNKAFDATPSPKTCELCPFEYTCAERQEQKKANSAKRNKNASSKLDIIIPEGGGFFKL